MKNSLVFSWLPLKILWENRKAAAILWLTPIFFLFILALIGKGVFQEENRISSFQIAIVDFDKTIETKLVIQQLTENEEISKLITTLQVNELQAEALMKKNKIAAIVYIPEGFSKGVSRGVNIPVRVVGNSERPLQAELVRILLTSAANYTSAAQSGINTVNDFMKEMGIPNEERIKEVKQTIVSFSLHVLGRNELFIEHKQNELFQQNIIRYYIISFYVLLIMIWSYIASIIVSGQIKDPIKKRLYSLGVSSFQTMVSTFVSCVLLVFISALAFLFPLYIWGNLLDDVNKILLLAGVSIVCILFSASFFILQSFFGNKKVYQAIGILFVLFGGFVGGHFIPTIYFPEWLVKFSHYSLNTWLFHFILAIFQNSSIHFGHVLPKFIILLFAFFLVGRVAISLRVYLKEGM